MNLKVITSLFFYTLFSFQVFAESKNKVWLEKDTLYYSGQLSEELNNQLFEFYTNHSSRIKTLAIQSIGGEINLGLDLGRFVYKQKLNIKVDSYCFSSCANYVFTAGNKKFVKGDAVVGFHGGASSMKLNTASLDQLPEPQRTEANASLNEYLTQTLKDETDYYEMIGVQQKITTLGQSVKFDAFNDGTYSGWYYSLEAYRQLGVENIIVNADTWLPKQLGEKGKVFKINLEDF